MMIRQGLLLTLLAFPFATMAHDGGHEKVNAEGKCIDDTRDSAHVAVTMHFVEDASDSTANGESVRRATPVRVEIVDGQGRNHCDPNGLPFEYDMRTYDTEASYLDALARPTATTWDEAAQKWPRTLWNPFTRNSHFYSAGRSDFYLTPGKYTVRVYKGIEYRIATTVVDIVPGPRQELVLPIERWIDMAATGWYSADDHVHISRPTHEFNPYLLKLFAGEDLNVASLLQVGRDTDTDAIKQYAFGPDGIAQEGRYIIAAGQENPRTHLLGHNIVLGGREFINFPNHYLLSQMVWREARRQGALAGIAHQGRNGADFALAMGLSSGAVDFSEILQFGTLDYTLLYDALNLGERLTPTAGTDFPFAGAHVPGRERFYTRVDGEFTFANWLEGVRRGRTFVTNGPLLTLRVNDVIMGDEVRLAQAGEVEIDASVVFDNSREHVAALEVVINGSPVYRRTADAGARDIKIHVHHALTADSWIAVRATGAKKGEFGDWQYPTNPDGTVSKNISNKSFAHSNAVFVHVPGSLPLAQQDVGKTSAQAWLMRLDDLHDRLSADRRTLQTNVRATDHLTPATMERDLAGLLEEIERARAFYRDILGQ